MANKYLKEQDITLAVQLGGPESGAANWGTAFNIHCSTQAFNDRNVSESIDETDRCDTLKQMIGLRASREVDFSLWVARATAMLFGSAVNQHIKLVVTYATTPNFTETLTGVIRENTRGSQRNQQIEVSIRMEVQSAA